MVYVFGFLSFSIKKKLVFHLFSLFAVFFSRFFVFSLQVTRGQGYVGSSSSSSTTTNRNNTAASIISTAAGSARVCFFVTVACSRRRCCSSQSKSWH